MTSDFSTVPYSTQQCRAFLKLLHGFPGLFEFTPNAFSELNVPPECDIIEGYRNCVIGRLYSEIYANYFVNLRGEPNARLSRSQRLLPEPEIRSPIWIKCLNLMMWKTPDKHHRFLRELWVDNVLYSQHWDHYMENLAYEWKYSATWSAVAIL